MLGVLYACMGLIFLPIFMLAAAAGAFAQHAQGAQASSTAPGAIVAPIKDRPDFEHLEAKGAQRLDHLARRAKHRRKPSSGSNRG